MRASEVAKLFGVTEQMVLRWGSKGLLSRTRDTTDNAWLYDRDEVMGKLQVDPLTYEYKGSLVTARRPEVRRGFDLEDTEEL